MRNSQTVLNHLNCATCSLRSQTIFCSMSEEDIHMFDSIKSVISYKPGETVFKQDSYPNGLFIVFSGKIKIYKTGQSGREMIVRLAKNGDIIGYRSLVGADKYTCSASALDNSILCFIPRDNLFKLFRQNPDIAFRMMKVLADDLKNAESNSTSLAQKQVRERVAESLLVLHEVYGFEADNETLNIRLTREEFAEIAGTVRETATKVLLDLNNDGIISLDGKKIKLLNINYLEKASQGIIQPTSHL